ncbi:S41 family peptidase [uncultured Erythrobacter sp.]|uniref:S41 family peptidase n=1 Tax=uncultured Erythrobacter sp. TaxID=263913 RepID=UPI0026167E95|nr:S41 family peptidase [uncultured Erythrobacter sp.]
MLKTPNLPLAGRTALSAMLAIALAACGGGGSSTPPTGGGGGTPTPTGTCSIANQIAFADDVLNEWYLFPSLLDNNVNQASFNSVQAYLDARVAPARAQSRDKGFTFATSIAEENALINSGSSAGFGIRLSFDTVNNRLFLFEAFENAPGFQAGMDRGTEITAIGTSSANLQNVSAILASGGPQAVIDALGPSNAGVSRVMRFTQVDGTVVEATVTKADFALDPLSDRYGALIINDGGKNVGYLNLRTFIVADAVPQLRDAFQLFNTNGVDELIIDFRYNGGGLVSVAETMGDLLGEGRVGQLWSQTVLRESKSSENSSEFFENEVQALQPSKIAFITTGNSASASELVINSMIPYLAADSIAIVGSNTSGKPVGQFGFDFDACDLRIRAVTFQTLNANDNGDYFTGLAGTVPNSCQANDDITMALGDANEASVATALDFLSGGSCTAISKSGSDGLAQREAVRETLQPEEPNVAQREIPGLY